MMKAAVQLNYGPPEVLTVRQVDRPSVAADEVLIAVRASALTQGDRRLRAADFPGLTALVGRVMFGVLSPRHRIPGSNFAGRVVAIGEDVTRFSVGDDVFGSVMHSAQAEFLAVSQTGALARAPSGMSPQEAAALIHGPGTALFFLNDLARIQRGERALIVGASGSVGRSAVQLAHHLGAEVTGVCSRDQDLVRSLGATRVIDYTREDFSGNGQRYDVVLDTTQVNRFGRIRGSLTPQGRYLSLHLSLRGILEMGFTSLRPGQRAFCQVAMPDQTLLERVRALAEANVFRPLIAKRFSLERIAEAHAFLEANRPRGEVIVDVEKPRDAPGLKFCA